MPTYDLGPCDCCPPEECGDCEWLWNGSTWLGPNSFCTGGCVCDPPVWNGVVVDELGFTNCYIPDAVVCNDCEICTDMLLDITDAGDCNGTYAVVYLAAQSESLGYPAWQVQSVNDCPTPGGLDTLVDIRCPGVENFLELFLSNLALGPFSPVEVSCGPPFYARFENIDLDAAFSPSCCPDGSAATLEFYCV